MVHTEHSETIRIRGKYYKRLRAEGSNIVLSDRDVAKAFPDSASREQGVAVDASGKASASNSAYNADARKTGARR